MRVTGDPGINFRGWIVTLDQRRPVEGTTPQDFPVEVGEGVSANAQNMGGSGRLTVQIVRGDEVLKESTTTARHGLAQVTWSPNE